MTLRLPMIILGDLSGIQNYLFDVAEEGGGQSQRLRARSFFLQVLAETAAIRILRALQWPADKPHFVLSGAGKFLLRGDATPSTSTTLHQQQQEINDWLRLRTQAELRFTLAWADEGKTDKETYQAAQGELQRAKAQPWRPAEAWNPADLILAPLGTPCELCRHAPGTEDEVDSDTGRTRRVCRTCADNREWGRRLPRARWLVIRDHPQGDEMELLGLGVNISSVERPPDPSSLLAITNLAKPSECPTGCPQEKFLQRRLMAYVPTNPDGSPTWFTDLAQQATGDHLLAVLKADADGLGVAFDRILQTGGLDAVAQLSEQLEGFFAGTLRQEIEANWRSIYTIFTGGDDLVMVGPWDVMVDFAGRMREMCAQVFRQYGLTLSAALALMKPKRPIKVAVAEAERLLEEAKKGTKDRLAAFGQVWKWEHHTDILKMARQLVEWVESGQMERGWLHTLLELTERRHASPPDLLATAHLTYHVSRNYKSGTKARQWAEQLINNFDNVTNPEVRYLPASVRYALVATRGGSERD
jgi:CRISPR-associated protein Csm1